MPAWLAIAASVAGYAACILVWRVLVRRWHLAGSAAPPRETLGEPEYLARRSLRALLAFDSLLIVPVAVLFLVMAALVPGLPPELLWGMLGALVFFCLPVPFLLPQVRDLEQRRLAGEPAPAPEPPGATGHTDLDGHLAGPVPGTRAAMAVIGAVSVADWLFPGARLGEWLCKDSEAILAGQIWRLVTVALVHGGAVHLFFNLSVLAGVGRLVERLAGTGAMLAVLFLGTAAGSLASTAFLPAPSVGASGGVLALAAAGGTFVWHRREVLPPEARKRMVRAVTELLLLNAVLTFVLPRVDWAGHAGGMLAGALLGLRLPPLPELGRILGRGDRGPPPDGLVR